MTTPSTSREHRRLLAGWGRAGASSSTVVDVDERDLAAAIKELPRRGGVARGLGRSYGDPAQNAGGHVLRLAPANERIVIDDETGTVTAGGGVQLDDLLALLIPRGWFVPVTPGTKFVTLGGAAGEELDMTKGNQREEAVVRSPNSPGVRSLRSCHTRDGGEERQRGR